MKRTAITLADGRELIYFDEQRRRRPRDCPTTGATCPRRRRPSRAALRPAGRRVGGGRRAPADPHLPAADRRVPALSVHAGPVRREIPAPDYDVVVFENRFPSFSDRVTPDEIAGADRR